MKIGISPKIGTPFVSMRGGVGGGVLIADAAAAAAAAATTVDDDDAVGCDCCVGVFFAAGLTLTPVVDFGLVGLLSGGVDLFGSLLTATEAAAAVTAVAVVVTVAAAEVVLVLSTFRFFFFGLSSMADSDVLTSFTGFD